MPEITRHNNQPLCMPIRSILLKGPFLEKYYGLTKGFQSFIYLVSTPDIFPHSFVRPFSAKNSLLVNRIDQHDVT